MTKIEHLMQKLPVQVDAALITSAQNRRYYTGFLSSAGILFVTKQQAYFLIDFRYFEAARDCITDCEVVLLTDAKKALKELCVKHAVKTVATENSYLTMTGFRRYEAMLAPVLLTDDNEVDRLILAQRRCKSRAEVEQIVIAQRLAEDAFTYILDRIKPGRTENEIALEMEMYMRSKGAEAVSFDFIVTSGINTAKPHGVPTSKPIATGDFITMDFGGITGGYHSDMTRTVAVGSATEKQSLVYHTVLEAQEAALAAISVGKRCNEIDKVVRDIIAAKGFGQCFGHGLGHSLGVEIHEDPRFSEACTDLVEPGIVMTVEPGIYISGEFGVRIEDTVYITENTVENITLSPKNLIIL